MPRSRKLAPVAPFIVDAELARTRITDAGLKTLAGMRKSAIARSDPHGDYFRWSCGRSARLKKLEVLNLTETAIDDAGVARLKALPTLKRVWLFGTKATTTELPAKMAAH